MRFGRTDRPTLPSLAACIVHDGVIAGSNTESVLAQYSLVTMRFKKLLGLQFVKKSFLMF